MIARRAVTSAAPLRAQPRPRPLLLRRRRSPTAAAAAGGGGANATLAARPDSPPPRLATSSPAAGSLDSSFEEDDGPAACPTFIDRDGDFVEAACCDFGFRSGRWGASSSSSAATPYGDDATASLVGGIPKSAFGLAVDNFQHEYSALRRSFRDDEYGKIAAQNPPQGPAGWLAYKAGEAVVRLLSAADAWLEDRRIFGRILPVPVPPEVFDARTGGVSRQCTELRAKLNRLTLSNDAVWARERAREEAGGGVDTPLVVRVAYLALCYFLDFAFNNRPLQRFWFLETVARMPYFSYVAVLHLYETLGWWRAGIELRRVHAAQEL